MSETRERKNLPAGRGADARCTGRFAPSPTGPLHFGSLVAALASFADAKRTGGRWLLRIEDIDPPRCVPGSADEICRTLEFFGFEWDEEPLYQSRRTGAYQEAIERLNRAGFIFPCGCSRAELGEGPYPGACRAGLREGRSPRSWRVRVQEEEIAFTDRIQGHFVECLASAVGDFVLLRADGIYSYQLAVVIDDAYSGVTDVVRGADLLDSTARQIYLHRLLGLAPPSYAHVPVVAGPDGAKLSKQTLAPPVNRTSGGGALWHASAFLGQEPPHDLRTAAPGEILAWAVSHWNLARVPQAKIATHSFD